MEPVTSLELSKELKNLGAPQDKSCFVFSNDGFTRYRCELRDNAFKHGFVVCAAFTAGELAELLPEGHFSMVPFSRNEYGFKPEKKWLAGLLGKPKWDGGKDYCCMGESYIDDEIGLSFFGDTEVEARGLLLRDILSEKK